MTPRLLSSRGHTLLEMTIALALGMLIVTASLSLYRGQRAAFDRAADAARIHDAASSASEMLAQQIQMAAFASSVDSPVDAPIFGCAQGRVIGADTTASCESLASHSDGLQVRYSADAVSTWPSTAGAPTDCLGQAVSDAIVTNRFYGKPSSSTGEPELYCEGGGRQAQPIVEGIERMRVMYWLAGRRRHRMLRLSRANAGAMYMLQTYASSCAVSSHTPSGKRTMWIATACP